MNRWWVYQKERFPLIQHAPLILVFSFSGLCYSSLLRGQEALPSGKTVITAFFTALFFFLQLRIADEFKDFDEDSKYRPYRPVPRGLIRLRELAWLFVLLGIGQFCLAWSLFPPLIWILGIAWVYLFGMSKEFFVGEWLRARPIAYLFAHMGIMPLIDLYVTSCDWRVAGLVWPSQGIYWFLVVSFFNGMLLEFGRKIRAPEDEEAGVNTYSAMWGKKTAGIVWLAAVTSNAIGVAFAARNIGFLAPAIAILSLLFFGAALVVFDYINNTRSVAAKRIEIYSGLWTLMMYLTLGPVSLAMELAQR